MILTNDKIKNVSLFINDEYIGELIELKKSHYYYNYDLKGLSSNQSHSIKIEVKTTQHKTSSTITYYSNSFRPALYNYLHQIFMSINFPLVLSLYFWFVYLTFILVLIIPKMILLYYTNTVQDWSFTTIIVYINLLNCYYCYSIKIVIGKTVKLIFPTSSSTNSIIFTHTFH